VVDRTRLLTKAKMVQHRGPLCEYCGERRATDMHEIICRSLTIGDDTAREISYRPELCSLLCRECHEVADNPQGDAALFSRNLRHYALWNRCSHEQNPVVISFHELKELFPALAVELPAYSTKTCPHCGYELLYPNRDIDQFCPRCKKEWGWS
jgi:predicted nucleic-acid-binding Zn-ribbon protein